MRPATSGVLLGCGRVTMCVASIARLTGGRCGTGGWLGRRRRRDAPSGAAARRPAAAPSACAGTDAIGDWADCIVVVCGGTDAGCCCCVGGMCIGAVVT